MYRAVNADNSKWYLKPLFIVIAICLAGPLATPLIWISPNLKRWHKILLTILTLLITVWTIKISTDLFRMLSSSFRDVAEVLK